MAVAFDAQATTVTADAGNTGTVTNTTLTIGATATLLIGSFVGADLTTAPIPSAMTWNGVSMTLVGHIATASGQPGNVYIYALVNPATGNHTLSCTYTAGVGGNDGIYLDCWSFNGTDTSSVANAVPAASVQTTAQTTTGTVFPNAAWSITTVTGDAISGIMQDVSSGTFGTTTGTLISFNTAVDGDYTSAYRLAVGATTTLQFTAGTANDICCGVAFRIQQPQTGVTTVILPPAPHPLPRKELPRADYPFFGFTDLAKEDIPRFGWHQWLSEPVRYRPPPLPVADDPFLAETLGFTPVSIPWIYPWSVPSVLVKQGLSAAAQLSYEFYTPIILPGTGNLLWFQPLSIVMVQYIIGSD